MYYSYLLFILIKLTGYDQQMLLLFFMNKTLTKKLIYSYIHTTRGQYTSKMTASTKNTKNIECTFKNEQKIYWQLLT